MNIILVGNPNTGKSTVFNSLTGLRQRTGNWAGVTVGGAVGKFMHNGESFNIIDLPGTYSLNPKSADEAAVYEHIKANENGVTVIVADATCFERNMFLALRIIKLGGNLILCINLMDEAAKKGIRIDAAKISEMMNIPVIATNAKKGMGIYELKQAIYETSRTVKPKNGGIDIEPCDVISAAVTFEKEDYNSLDRKIDSIVTSKVFGIPIMFGLVFTALYITIVFANYPSGLLMSGFGALEDLFVNFFNFIKVPDFITDMLVFGVYRVLSWVVAVMLPPMAIFYPIFSLLEDFGLLPRIAFNMDGCFKCAGAHGKQALTTCMGLGCNAAGVTSCRIIESKRERLLAILTNSFTPCNGRFPSLIITAAVMAGIFGLEHGAVFTAFFLLAAMVFSIAVTLCTSKALSKTLLSGARSGFLLELPPYRKPQFFSVVFRSMHEKTVKTLARAVCAAIPAGFVLWILQIANINGQPIINHMITFLDPFGKTIGLDGVILTAFILGFPANEIVIPIMLLCYGGVFGAGLINFESLSGITAVLIQNGWTFSTVICAAIFFICRFPCATTLLTVKKETKSWLWTAAAFLIPTLMGVTLCFLTSLVLKLFC